MAEIRMILLKFSFSSEKVVPPEVKKMESEAVQEMEERKARGSGMLALEPIHSIGLLRFLEDLKEAGFELVNALYQLRRADDRGRTFHMVRYDFCRRDYVELSREFQEKRESIEGSLHKICLEAAWRVRAFVNPFFLRGEMVPGQTTVAINLEARKPLIDGNGQRIVAWKKDGQGNRIGFSAVPVEPDHILRLHEGSVLNFE